MSVTFSSGQLRITLAGLSHVGRKRAHNEDSFHVGPDEGVVVVADGMGGHASGDVASRLAVETIGRYFRETIDEPETTWPYKMSHNGAYYANRLSTAIKLANAAIWETAHANAAQAGMGTTVVALQFAGGGATVAHVGDSRVYRLRGGVLEQITDDHSLINDYMKMKNLRADEVGNFPQKNVIVRALGMKESVQVDIAEDHPRPGDLYLLCSDGLSGMITDKEITKIIGGTGSLDAECEQLVQAANDHGGLDNITAVLARVEKS